jgi:hypothetical protein
MAFKRIDYKNQQPRNNNSVTVAQTSLQLLAPVFQKQYQNAMAVNGYPCVFYSVLQAGRRCSCSFNLNKQPDADGITPIFDEQGDANLEFISSMLGGSSFSIDRYATRRNLSEKQVKDATQIDHEDINRTSKIGERRIDTSRDTELDSPKTRDVLSKQREVDRSNFPNDDVFIEDPSSVEDVLSGQGSAVACGICFGTGFIGGFSIHKGFKADLDTTWEPSTSRGFTVSKVNLPHAYESVDSEGYLEWTVVLPRGAINIEVIKVFNNRTPLWSGFTLEIKNDEFPTFEQINYLSLLKFCNGRPATVRLSVSALLDVFVMTHVTFQIMMSSIPTFIDYPHLNKTSDTTVLDAIDQVQLNVAPEVPLIKPYDLIFDRVFNKLWRITTVDDFIDRIQNEHGHNCNARVVQEFETLWQILPRRNERSSRRYYKPFSLNGNFRSR